ncbi:MAG: TIGR04283 family arsenosugar biosynthesis glycosyltransferase [Chitinophagaceae bacterium]|nr:TIGR04283 family arsenosugar biosynthesis glycosyltransferase [Chitinophagaceae bacterium]
MQLSIIIPAFNEAAGIGKLVSFLRRHAQGLVAEIIVADGGSTDATIAEAKAAGAVVISCKQKGRAVQMNEGAAAANGDILYFVHADTFPPEGYAQDIITAVQRGAVLGRYQTRFSSRKWYLKINAWFTRFDWFICMGGDNTLFITRKCFKANNGFDASMQIMEEYEFCQRVRKEGAVYKVLKGKALVSARKYDTNSWWTVQRANKKIVDMYRKGASQEEMVSTYRRMLRYR